MNHMAAAAVALTPEEFVSCSRVAGHTGLRGRRVEGMNVGCKGIDLQWRQGSESRHASGGNAGLDEIA
jgi:hypothetical protein